MIARLYKGSHDINQSREENGGNEVNCKDRADHQILPGLNVFAQLVLQAYVLEARTEFI